jgi:flagellar hook-associated protein 2
MATSVTAPITFTGSSSFSSSFQQVLTRAVQIASLPMQQMQNHVSDLLSQETALSSLQAAFSSLQNALQSVDAATQGVLTATADTSDVSGSASSDALPGTYTIQVDSIGSSTTTLSEAGTSAVTDPTTGNISSSSTFTLTINGAAHTISPSGNSLQSLAAAINDAGLGVQATIINVGSNSGLDYRLAISSTGLGPDTIQLNDGSTDLLQTLATGSYAQYKLNGSTVDVQSDSRQVTLAPGLTVTLEQPSASGQPTTITVGEDYSGFQTSLSNLASAYNSAVDALSAQRGQNAGALAGQGIVQTLQNALWKISQYTTGSGSLGSTTALGLEMDQNGHLSVDSTVFDTLSTTDIQTFLGGLDSSGFLKAAGDAINSVADTTSGNIQDSISSLQNEVTKQTNQISEEQQRINDIQNSLQQRLAAADAAIATLEQQKTYYADLFAAEYLQNNPNNPTA